MNVFVLVIVALVFVILTLSSVIVRIEHPNSVDAFGTKYLGVGASTPKSDINSTLVVLFGNMRGGKLAWGSVMHHVMKPLNADLALLTDLTLCDQDLASKAKFLWHVQEVPDWGLYIDLYNKGSDWRQLFCSPQASKLNHNQFGGVVPKCGIGSGAIGLVFREEARKYLMGLPKQYEWVIFQRSDFLFECDHVSLRSFDKNIVYIKSTGHHITTDRAMIAHRTKIDQAFGIVPFIFNNVELWLDKYQDGGIEMAIANYFKAANVTFKYYDVPAGNVKRPSDPTRWSRGESSNELESFGLLRKYWSNDKKVVRNLCGKQHSTQEEYQKMLNYF